MKDNNTYMWEHGGSEFKVKILSKTKSDIYTLQLLEEYRNKGGYLIFEKGQIVKQQNAFLSEDK